jgi:LacI family transcriptional regulator
VQNEASNTKRKRGKVTLADVARAAGVSTTAVSYALNGKGRIPEATRQAVLEAARRLGYEANYYAQRIKGGSTTTLACFNESIAGVAGEKVTRIQQEFVRRGYSSPLHGLGHVSPAETLEAVRELRRQRPRAILFSGSQHTDVLDELRRFRDEGGTVICYDHPYPPDFEQVNYDREGAAYDAVRYLIEKGHRDIGLSTHTTHQEEPPRNVFTRGFLRALEDSGLAYHSEWYCPFYPFEPAGQKLAAHFRTMTSRPSSLYIVDDRMATSFVNHTLRGGLRIPLDVSIVTHDQSGVADHGIVPLTVVSHPVSQIVATVVDMVMSRVTGQYDGPPRHTVIPGQLVERSSVRTKTP